MENIFKMSKYMLRPLFFFFYSLETQWVIKNDLDDFVLARFKS